MSERNLGLRCMPRLERLEDSCVPAVITYIVDRATDANPAGFGVGSGNTGDLRWCLTGANNHENDAVGPDKITFAAGISPVIKQALPEISDGVIITGNGPGNTTVSAYTVEPVNYRIFKINAGKTVSIEKLRMTNGQAPAGQDGGGVLNEGNLTLSQVQVDNCSAANGGGVANTGNGPALLDQVYIHHNTASANGGGVYFETDHGLAVNTITNSIIYYNTAAKGGGVYNSALVNETYLYRVEIGANVATADGGGIYNAAGCHLKMEEGGLTGNQAEDGGGAWNAGDAIFMDLEITYNTAADKGGGLYLKSGSLTAARSSITDNAASLGTALYTVFGSSFTNEGTTITGTQESGF